MRVTLVHNPTAGDEQHDRESLTAAIIADGHEVVYQSVKADDWEDALSERADRVVVAGGDGTVRKVFKELAGSSIPVTVIPVGTANNIARTLGFETSDAQALVRGWSNAEHRPFDVGEIRSRWGQVAFVEATGGGVLAELLVQAEGGRDDKVRHGLELLDGLLERAPTHHWEVDVDGDYIAGEFLAVEVMNVRQTGPQLPLAPDSSSSSSSGLRIVGSSWTTCASVWTDGTARPFRSTDAAQSGSRSFRRQAARSVWTRSSGRRTLAVAPARSSRSPPGGGSMSSCRARAA